MQLHRDIRGCAEIVLQENGKSNFPHTGSKFVAKNSVRFGRRNKGLIYGTSKVYFRVFVSFERY